MGDLVSFFLVLGGLSFVPFLVSWSLVFSCGAFWGAWLVGGLHLSFPFGGCCAF